MNGRVLVMMGVSGAGKSTLAARLAAQLGWDFAEGDELHPVANVAKMSAGEPLTDADRAPWLQAIRAWIDSELDSGRSGVITCSGLKRRYRDQLRRPGVRLVYLEVTREELERRLAIRSDHFMPASLLESQLSDLEPPQADEDAITVAVADPDQAMRQIASALQIRV